MQVVKAGRQMLGEQATFGIKFLGTRDLRANIGGGDGNSKGGAESGKCFKRRSLQKRAFFSGGVLSVIF